MAAAAIVTVTSCTKPAPAPTTEVIIVSANTVPSDPADAAWQRAPEYSAPLVLQDLVEPRQMAATTTAVRVRAITNGAETAFRLQWVDSTRNDVPVAGQFSDACAVQLPQKAGVNLPVPQMGEKGGAVDIAYWNAARQVQVEGGLQSIKDIYPNATVDHYPFEAKPLEKSPTSQQAMAARYAPALAVGNSLASRPATPVQDLIAEGPGTLTPAPSATSRGKGIRTPDGWAVVIVRAAPIPAVNARANVALAVWDGAHEEAGARKMRTGWMPAAIQEHKP